MQHPQWHNIHPNFNLNGIHYGFDELLEVGYSLVKEGDPFEQSLGDFLVEWGMQTATVMVRTSGSTGAPKAILLKKEHMINSALASGEYFNLQPGDKALLCLPCTGIAGKMMLVRAMVLGLALDYVEASSLPLSGTQKIYDFTAMVPLQVEKSLNQLPQVKTLIIGGAPVSSGLREKLQAVSTQCYETYGMTETITHVAVKSMQNSKLKIENSNNPIVEQSNNRAVQQSNFTALPNITFSKDNRGCLVVDAPKISDKPVVTNDIVVLHSETEFQWLGRFDSVINSGGVKLIPEQIEQKIAPLVAARFFVVGIPDETLGQKLVLVIEGEETDSSELLQQIKSLKDLDKYEVPKDIFFLSSFKETASGKVDRLETLKTSTRSK
ncbi:AMP-binding protein [Flagellimonas myxillae]|uniref:AMP-binding protein n=1 Tax=Flagellimonas myxillae TaxID=2942214 RepID=UPI00201F355F|nr:AMP-binding protein [Muricauda myxillae]MCL6266129.1 AMP-binding protein [Muricauda myxillae]